jgi:hypothetical protein
MMISKIVGIITILILMIFVAIPNTITGIVLYSLLGWGWFETASFLFITITAPFGLLGWAIFVDIKNRVIMDTSEYGLSILMFWVVAMIYFSLIALALTIYHFSSI